MSTAYVLRGRGRGCGLGSGRVPSEISEMKVFLWPSID